MEGGRKRVFIKSMAPDRIFKRPECLKNRTLERRETSKRTRTKTVKYQSQVNLSAKVHRQLNKWSAKEVNVLIEKIQKYGSDNLEDLLDEKIQKNVQQIKDILQYFKRKNRNHPYPHCRARNQIEVTEEEKPKEDHPLEDWIDLTECVTNASIKDSVGDVNVASNWTHLVQDAISVIADEENHPNPQDCDGVDYQEIYEYILSIMAGEVPKEINGPTAEKILQMMAELR